MYLSIKKTLCLCEPIFRKSTRHSDAWMEKKYLEKFQVHFHSARQMITKMHFIKEFFVFFRKLIFVAVRAMTLWFDNFHRFVPLRSEKMLIFDESSKQVSCKFFVTPKCYMKILFYLYCESKFIRTSKNNILCVAVISLFFSHRNARF